jgi:glycosyltransferase involved in cell wall biosynthesis
MLFQDPQVAELQEEIFKPDGGEKGIRERIDRLKDNIYRDIERFLDEYHIELIIVENALSIPMHVPLALALAALIEDRRLPTIAHHHDFIWERERFARSWMRAELDDVFPPDIDSIQHVVINTLARDELRRRKDIQAEVIPNIFDFTHFNYGLNRENIGFREAVDVEQTDWLILQPTRIVPRKGIERSIQLVSRMRTQKYRQPLSGRDVKLVLSHPSGDEGQGYLAGLKKLARADNVPLVYAADKIATVGGGADVKGKYELWDAYLNADFVTYPSLIEGFGNAFLEAVYFRLPLLIRRYPVFVSDIEPLGFDLLTFDEDISEDTVEQVVAVMADPTRRRRMVEWNFNLARENYSYQTFIPEFRQLIEKCMR